MPRLILFKFSYGGKKFYAAYNSALTVCTANYFSTVALEGDQKGGNHFQNDQFLGYIFGYTFGSEITFYDSVDTSQ